MARGPLTFRQRDVVAAIKAVEAAGHKVARVEIGKDGRIVIVMLQEGSIAPPANEWDEILESPTDVRPGV
jgi:hypothetical protein